MTENTVNWNRFAMNRSAVYHSPIFIERAFSSSFSLFPCLVSFPLSLCFSVYLSPPPPPHHLSLSLSLSIIIIFYLFSRLFSLYHKLIVANLLPLNSSLSSPTPPPPCLPSHSCWWLKNILLYSPKKWFGFYLTLFNFFLILRIPCTNKLWALGCHCSCFPGTFYCILLTVWCLLSSLCLVVQHFSSFLINSNSISGRIGHCDAKGLWFIFFWFQVRAVP